MVLTCKIDPKNSGIQYKTVGDPESINMGFNYFELCYKAERIYPEKWKMENEGLLIPLNDIGTIYTEI